MHSTIHYQPLLVALSYVISVFGSYTALQLAMAIPQAKDGKAVFRAVAAAAVALGGGAIWSMHFIAMTAADMGVPVSYDATLTYLSLAMGIGASAVGLYLVGRTGGHIVMLIAGGTFTGLGVAFMHYTGMAAMIMPVRMGYDMTLFLLSIAIAVVAACVALWLAFNLRGNLQRVGSALVMGVAVCGMHYTGMYAVQMDHEVKSFVDAAGSLTLSASGLAYTVFAITAVLLTLLLGFNAKARRTLARQA